MRYDIRCREFDFAHAPDLDGETAWYQAALLSSDGHRLESLQTKHRRAIDAAREAASLDHHRQPSDRPPQGRAAYVGCEHPGIERPKGAMKKYMYVSYRPREARA